MNYSGDGLEAFAGLNADLDHVTQNFREWTANAAERNAWRKLAKMLKGQDREIRDHVKRPIASAR